MKNKKVQQFSTETELIAGIIDKEKSAFCFLYDKYATPIFGVIYGITADKILSEELLVRSFCIFWETARNFKPRGSRILASMLRIAGTLARESIELPDSKIREENKYVNDSKELINLET